MRNPFKGRDFSEIFAREREAARRQARERGFVEDRSLACRSGDCSEQCLDPAEFLPTIGCLCPCHDGTPWGVVPRSKAAKMMRWIRLWLTEPREAAYCTRGRLACRLLRLHGSTCDGRMDHWPPREAPGRWQKSSARWRV